MAALSAMLFIFFKKMLQKVSAASAKKWYD